MVIAATNICFLVMNILNIVTIIVGKKIPLYMNIIIMTIRLTFRIRTLTMSVQIATFLDEESYYQKFQVL